MSERITESDFGGQRLHHHVVLFTKPAVPGLVKTRMQKESSGASKGWVLTADEAAGLHAAFLEDVAQVLRDATLDSDSVSFQIAWATDGGMSPDPGFEQEPWISQMGETLGERLYNGLLCARGPVPSTPSDVLIAVGSDHPELRVQDIREALAMLSLNEVDVVVGPADDGGYYLFGTRREVLTAEMFKGIPWSTDQVLAMTLEACKRLDLGVKLLPMRHDCDTPDDLRALSLRLARADVDRCAATRLWLTAKGLLES